ncbi:cupredoxin domain-containing protein [Candidatus Micrarchaeota archaeon]|nr:cupredoxin domain-containing protein [Candidatus Micrarchaeota archaeon]
MFKLKDQIPRFAQATAALQAQQVSLKASESGYDKQVIDVKAGVPVHLSFSADASAGCGTTLIIDRLPVNLVSNNGQSVTADFTPAAGTYAYHCPAGVLPPGKLVAS